MYDYPFTIRKLTKEEGGGYLAEAFDLQGCFSDGETIQEAADNLQDAIKCWVLASEELGDEIPSPSKIDDYSGKYALRMPKKIHRDLTLAAKREGVSLNTWMVTRLSQESVIDDSVQHALSLLERGGYLSKNVRFVEGCKVQ